MPQLEDILQYHFNNPRLLTQALTHSSVTNNEHRNYERLEFLGDRVLGMTMAHLLFKMFPDDREGQLSQRHVKLVCADAVARQIHCSELNLRVGHALVCRKRIISKRGVKIFFHAKSARIKFGKRKFCFAVVLF